MVSTGAPIAIDGLTPSATAQPGSADELAETLRAANDAGQAVAPVGGGTQLDLGNPPARLDLAINTTGLNRVVEYEPADLTVTVEAGVRFADLQATLAENGQMLALDPPAALGATIGGLVATNASGPLRFAHGTARDLVIGTRVANPDGALTRAGGRVVKNVAGYDLNKLHVGGLGTLGILVELSFKLAPIPPASGTVLGEFGDLDAVRGLLTAVLHSTLSPLAVELLGPGALVAPGLAGGTAVVLRVGGYAEAVERQVRDLRAMLQANGGQLRDADDATWSAVKATHLTAYARELVLKAAAPPARTAELVNLLVTRLTGSGAVVWAHAGNGIAFAACDSSPEARVLLDLRQAVLALGSNASLVVQRCPAVLKRSVEVWGDPGASLTLMRALKSQLDPKSTLNPGRYVGGI
jgi:glycolate dehydrogenase FAD-binding subunit